MKLNLIMESYSNEPPKFRYHKSASTNSTVNVPAFQPIDSVSKQLIAHLNSNIPQHYQDQLTDLNNQFEAIVQARRDLLTHVRTDIQASSQALADKWAEQHPEYLI